MAVVLETQGLSLSFGAVVAADNIHFAVEEREVVGLIGANGAGKTTFLNLVTGYLRPRQGRILYFGQDITGHPPRELARRGICRSFQIPQLFPSLSALDNALLALCVAKLSDLRLWSPVRQPDRLDRARAVLEDFGIGSYAEQPTGTLPQGIRKLLDIAIATVGEPRLVLLDEPTSGVSVEEKFTVMDRLMTALVARGVTILFVEHDMEIVERYAGRVAAFYDGRILADGPPQRVLGDPEVRQRVVGTEMHRRRSEPQGTRC